MATSTAPHLDQLEYADRLRDHVFTLVRAGEMNAALILIRADVHSAALALAAGTRRNLQVVMPVEGAEDPGQEEPDDDAEDAPTESENEDTDSEAAVEETTDEDVDDPVKTTPAVPDATMVAAMVG